jgi:hypothetical protein
VHERADLTSRLRRSGRERRRELWGRDVFEGDAPAIKGVGKASAIRASSGDARPFPVTSPPAKDPTQLNGVFRPSVIKASG